MQEAILGNSVPHYLGGPKVMDNSLKEMLLEAKKDKETDHSRRLERNQQKVLNPLMPTSQNGQKHSNNLSATADELFECV